MFPAAAFAADGTWVNAAGGNWGDPANWTGGTVAEGTGATANFNTIDLTAATPVTLGEVHTVGTLNFADVNLDPAAPTPFGYVFGGSTLTLAASTGSPVINVGNTTATFNNALAGTNGFTKTGTGTLFLNATSTLTGTVFLNGGEISYANAAVATANQLGTATINFNGGTLTQFGATGTSGTTTAAIANALIVPVGQVGNINMSRRGALTGALTGGGTMNVTVNYVRSDLNANWSAFTGQINVRGNAVDGGNDDFRLLQGNGFANARVDLGAGVSMYQAFNPPSGTGTQTVQNIGELSGAATAYLGGNPVGGRFVNWTIGALNTISTYNGLISDTVGLGAARLTKVGTGKLFLGGSNVYTGATQVNAGTLGFVGTGHINGSLNVNFATGTTLDVSGTTAEYSTGPNQTVTMLGTANVVGNYLHDEGILVPGGVGTATTLNFANNFDVSGGNLNFDITPTLAAGGTNDLFNVAGTSNLSGNATLNVNTIGTFSQGTYTIIQTAGGITGSAAGWTVAFGSRGAAPALSISPDGKALQLTIAPVVGSAANLSWKGTVNGVWDIATTANWYNRGTSADDKFFQFDNVTFGDFYTNDGAITNVNNTAIVLNSLVQPGSMLFTSDSQIYSITGTGSIGGTGTLNKSGGSVLTLGTANTYSGGTTLTNGRINLTNGAGLGTGTVTISNNAILDFGANALGNAVIVNGAATIRAGAAGGTSGINAISGTGTITFQQTLGVFDLRGSMAGFNGVVNFENAIPALTGALVRFNGFSGGENTIFNLGDNGVGFNKRNNAATLALGGITGGASAFLSGANGSATATNYVIGARSADNVFDGLVSNGGGPVTITKVGTATLTLNGANTYTGATVVQAGKVVLGVNAQQPVFGGALVATPAGADIQGGKIAFAYADLASGATLLATVDTALTAGFGQPTQFATGTLRSTTLAAGRVLGFRDNGVDAVEVAYTIPGDADLSFAVNFDDLLALAQNYDPAATNKTWSQGDFNYDNVVNFDDLLTLAQNYGTALSVEQASTLGTGFAADYALALSQVPEPTSLALVGGVSSLLLGRRRRNG